MLQAIERIRLFCLRVKLWFYRTGCTLPIDGIFDGIAVGSL
jgi:hypothetical protein